MLIREVTRNFDRDKFNTPRTITADYQAGRLIQVTLISQAKGCNRLLYFWLPIFPNDDFCRKFLLDIDKEDYCLEIMINKIIKKIVAQATITNHAVCAVLYVFRKKKNFLNILVMY